MKAVREKGKYHRSTGRQETLVFGMVSRQNGACIFRTIETISRERIFAIIQERIGRGGTLLHDCLATYDTLGNLGYAHSVDDSEYFVAPDGTHTNTIEGTWGLLKQRISYGHGLPSSAGLNVHQNEFSYKSYLRRKRWKKNGKLLSTMSKFFRCSVITSSHSVME